MASKHPTKKMIREARSILEIYRYGKTPKLPSEKEKQLDELENLLFDLMIEIDWITVDA